MWLDFLKELNRNCGLEFNAAMPAKIEEIADAEKELGIEFPQILTQLYLEIDGDKDLIMSLESMVSANMIARTTPGYMPLDCLLFFAGNGCGDYLGFAVIDNEVDETKLYAWDHELDNRTWVAKDIKTALTRLYNSELL